MQKIILLNYGLKCTKGVYRQMWMATEGDIVVSPIPVAEQFLSYVCELQGIDPDRITVLDLGQEVTDEVMAAPELASRLRALTGDPRGWELVPAAYTEGVATLAQRLGLDLDTGLRFTAQRGPDLLNRKSHFRQLASAAAVPIPEGSLATSARGLADAIERHLPRTGTVIVKRDNDLGGHGNRALTTKTPGPRPGVTRTLPVDGNVPETAAELWAELTDEEDHVVVVESYHSAAEIFYFEYLVGRDGHPQILDSGTRREAPADPPAPSRVWVGLELPAQLPPGTALRAGTEAARIARIAADLGYRGYLNVDAILTDEGELFFNEVNARWGGGLALHTIGERLIGPSYADSHVVSGLRTVPPMTFADGLALLRRHGLAFSPETGEGVLIIGYDSEGEKATECVLVARSRARVREIEDRLCAVAGTVTDPEIAQ